MTLYLSQSSNIGYGIYNSSWIEQSPKILKSWIIVLQRSQQPVVIHIGGILPKLSLSYYAQVNIFIQSNTLSH